MYGLDSCSNGSSTIASLISIPRQARSKICNKEAQIPRHK
jgi:hypothetical protein